MKKAKPKKKDQKKKVEEEKVIEEDVQLKKIDVVAPKNKWWSIRYLLRERKRWKNDHRTFLINMELSNGFVTNFICYPHKKDNTFKYQSKKYIIDESMKYYNLTSSTWCLDYHQNFTAPIQRKIELKQIKDEINQAENIEIEYATNPSLIEEFTVSKIAEGIMKGRYIDDLLKQLRLMMIINMLFTGLILLLLLKTMGII